MTSIAAPPAVSDATRREFLALLGAAGLLAGCGGPAATDQSPAATTRIAETPRGPVQIPAQPQRLVALYTHDLANALALGLAPIAGPGEQGQPGSALPAYLVEQFAGALDGLEVIQHRPELDFEQIAALAPDCILSGIFGPFDPGFDELEAIAPTVTYRYSEGEGYEIVPWRDVLRQNAAQFGREQAAEDWIARFDERAAALRERIASRYAGASWATIQPTAEQFYLSGPAGGHTSVTLVDELGLPLAPGVERLLAAAGPLQQGGAAISYERIAEVDADIVFVSVSAGVDGQPDRTGVDQLAAQPLWVSVPAVGTGEVHEYVGDIGYESGPMAWAFLDVVERSLLTP